MALASMGTGWALAMMMLYASVLIPGNNIVAFVAGVMAIIPIGCGIFLQDPLDRRSPMWLAAGWILGLIANYLFHMALHQYIGLALYGAALGIIAAMGLHYAERHIPARCSVCGGQSQLHSQLELPTKARTPYVLIDYGARICPTCEARLLSAAHTQVCNSIQNRLRTIGPLPPELEGDTT